MKIHLVIHRTLILTLFGLFATNTHAQDTYLLTITDSTKIITVGSNGPNTTVIFSDPALNAITANYTVTKFEKAYPSSRFPHLRRLWLVRANNTFAYINQLKNSNPSLFPEGKIYGVPVLLSNYYPGDWHVWDDGYLEYINAPGAWGITHGDPNVVIGVTDTYFDLNNPDLQFKVAQSDIVGGNGSLNHGNRVAGLIAGATDNVINGNGIGFPSIGFNCRLDVSDSWGNFNTVIQMSRRGRRVINVSWGGGFHSADDQDACNEIYENGTFLVASAGNGYESGPAPGDNFYPAAYDNVFSVSGVCWQEQNGSYNRAGMHELNLGDTMNTFQHNASVDLVAPGYFIGGLRNGSPWFVNGDPIASGTSFASPLVAGTAGLMLSVNPCLSPYQMEYWLKKSANNTILGIPENIKYAGKLGAGLLDAASTVQKVDPNTTIINVCNTPGTETLYIAGVEINTLCAPGIAANGAIPKLTPIIQNGTPPYTYRWEAVVAQGNTSVLNDSAAAEPEIVSSSAGPNGHIAAFRLTVYDASEVRKVARRFFTVKLRTAAEPDLALRDSYMDMLDEPNNMNLLNERDWQIWQSPDVWVRQSADNGLEHQNPEYLNNNTNEVYTRVRNVGCATYTPNAIAPAAVQLYWTKASTGESWKYDWDGHTSVAGSAGGTVPAGGQIGTQIPVPALEPGKSVILGAPWHPQQPQSYLGSPTQVDVCLLARIQEYDVSGGPFPSFAEHPMAITERINQSTTYNVKSNNNIVTRNVLVQNLNPLNRGGDIHIIDVANAETKEAYFDLQLINEKEINKHFAGDYSALGEVQMQLGDLYDRWKEGGGVISGNGIISSRDKNVFIWDGTGEVVLHHIRLDKGDRFPVGITFRLKNGVSPVTSTHTMHLRQFEEGDSHNGMPYGNVTMQVSIQSEDKNLAQQRGSSNIAKATQSYTVFPNPATNIVFVQRLSLTNQPAAIQMMDITGRTLHTAYLPSGTDRLAIPVTGLATGIYIIDVREGNTSAGHYRVVVK